MTEVVTTLEDRTLEVVYVTDSITDEGQAYLVISAYHYAPAKAFIASVRRERQAQGISRIRISALDRPPVHRAHTPVARYSEKALREAHAAFIAKNNLADPEVLASLLQWASVAR